MPRGQPGRALSGEWGDVTEHQGAFLFLFSVDGAPDQVAEPLPVDESVARNFGRLGAAGQHLVIADIQIRGYDAAEWNGIDVDIVADMPAGTVRRFQVKSSVDAKKFGRVNDGPSRANGVSGGSRSLTSYKGKIDAFAFAHLRHRLVYYFHINAVTEGYLYLSDKCWTRQACDLSFTEFMRRIGEVP